MFPLKSGTPRRESRERSVSLVPAERWDTFVRQHRYGHFLQTTAWGTLKSSFGWRAVRTSVASAGGEIVGGAVVLLRRLPAGLGALAYVPRGPVADWDQPKLAGSVIDATCALARARGAIGMVVEPELLDTPLDQRTLTQFDFRPLDWTVQPRRTIWVNLDVDEEVDILARMKQKTRYNVGLAGRKGVVVRECTLDDLPAFYALMQTTSDRNEFSIHGSAYYQTFLQLFPRDSALLIAFHDDAPLAGLIVVANGKRATYLYGASSSEKRELMATYALQWKAMRWARDRGCHTYDLWGVPDADEDALEAQFNDRNDGLWGVYRFKRGFGGQVVRHVGAWVKIFSPMRWRLFDFARHAYARRGRAVL